MDLAALGQRIQRLRLERALTLQRLAELSSVSVSMLSAVERGDKAATVVVLDRIAAGLDVRLTELLTEPEAERIIVRRAAEQDTVAEPGGWHRTILTPVVPGVNFEWVRSTLPPGCVPADYPPYAPGSHEFIFVESGTVTLTIDGDRTVELTRGDSVYLAADVTLRYANHTAEPCTYYVAALVMRPRRARQAARRPPAPVASSRKAAGEGQET
ncbi:transcriptional regulator with XRE-family HTH domain [Saccharomonospora amisosensis]|uniref:Transcriptional regulator with XRE-family HTH domain n=1 Tax=Saccharomonospora amisosensis TaxID=1128677 RepID=A0A7X5UVC1_9PSEU|nr:cupin domain-containing protein [Saccharomonospora amisosensis]NIJ14868.1 transcriptional regulator with XRE-family HTH domain [Saccharomonospora amisosensis]